jgi:hypothetical protein
MANLRGAWRRPSNLVPLRPRNAIDELQSDRLRRSRNIDDMLREHHRPRGGVLGGPSDTRVWSLCGLRQTLLRTLKNSNARKPAPAAVMMTRCRAAGLKHDRRSVFVKVFLYPTGK